MSRYTCLGGACVFLALAAVLGDTVELTNGRTLHGKILPGDSPAEVTIETPDGTLTFPRNKVKQQRVEPVSAPAATQAESVPVAATPTTHPADPSAKPPVPPDLAALLDKADAEPLPAKALLVYEQARGLFPKDMAVPKAMAAHFQDGITLDNDNPNRRLYGRAMAWILALDPGNPLALNNAGVIDALDENFAQSFPRLAKAAPADKGDLAVQNLSQAVYMDFYKQEKWAQAWRKGYICEGWNGWSQAEWIKIVHTVLATMHAQEDPGLRKVIDIVHRQQKKHVAEECWGGVWLPADQVAAFRANNKAPWSDIQEGVRWVKVSDDRGNIKDMTFKGPLGRKAIYGWILTLKVPDHPGKLVLIDESGGEAKSLPIPCGIQPSEEGLDGSGDPKRIRKGAQAVP